MMSIGEIYAALTLALYMFMNTAGQQVSATARCPARCHCSKQQLLVSCIGLQLKEIPADIPLSAKHLYLDNNLLTKISADAFIRLTNLTVLRLTMNVLTDIDPKAFNGLKHLKRLYLTQNQLSILQEAVFAGLDNLIYLYLSQNKLTEIPDVGLARNISKITLEHNEFSNARFPKGFGKLAKLKSVVISNNANIKSLNHTDLLFLKNSGITKFFIARCSLKWIANNTFTNFTELRSLKLSYNPDIELASVKALIVVSLPGTGLTALDLSGILTSLPADLFSPLADVPLRDLVLAQSTFAVIHNGTFRSLSQLFHLDLSNCKIRATDNGAFNGLHKLESLKLNDNRLVLFPSPLPDHLRVLDISHNMAIIGIPEKTFLGLGQLTHLSLSHCSLRVFRMASFQGLSNLKSLDLSYNQIGGTNIGAKVFKPMPQLQELNLSHNKLTTIATEYSLFAWLPNLQNMYLNDNKCGNLSVLLFNKLEMLRTLHLQDNQLGNLISSDTGGVLFSKLTALRELHLEKNGLTSLPGRMISSLGSLKKLYLQENYITNWGDGFFNGTTSIRMVNLTRNKIAYVNESSLSSLSNDATTLYLSANPFSCDCDLIWFRDWLDTMNSSHLSIPDIDKCTCSAPVSLAGRPLKSFHPESIKEKCFPPPWHYIIVGAVGGGVLVVLVMVGLIYAKRWTLRIWKYRFKKWLRNRRTSALTRAGYTRIESSIYDVFVSYGPSEPSRDWVTNELYPKLAAIFGDDRIFIDEKALPNKNLYEELADAIYASRKALLVISADYLEDSRRKGYEVPCILEHMVQVGELRERLILVLWGDDIGERLPQCLRPFLGHSDLCWPDNETGREAFWLHLQDKFSNVDRLEVNDTSDDSPNVPDICHVSYQGSIQ